jgi:hypothetical protein
MLGCYSSLSTDLGPELVGMIGMQILLRAVVGTGMVATGVVYKFVSITCHVDKKTIIDSK